MFWTRKAETEQKNGISGKEKSGNSRDGALQSRFLYAVNGVFFRTHGYGRHENSQNVIEHMEAFFFPHKGWLTRTITRDSSGATISGNPLECHSLFEAVKALNNYEKKKRDGNISVLESSPDNVHVRTFAENEAIIFDTSDTPCPTSFGHVVNEGDFAEKSLIKARDSWISLQSRKIMLAQSLMPAPPFLDDTQKKADIRIDCIKSVRDHMLRVYNDLVSYDEGNIKFYMWALQDKDPGDYYAGEYKDSYESARILLARPYQLYSGDAKTDIAIDHAIKFFRIRLMLSLSANIHACLREAATEGVHIDSEHHTLDVAKILQNHAEEGLKEMGLGEAASLPVFKILREKGRSFDKFLANKDDASLRDVYEDLNKIISGLEIDGTAAPALKKKSAPQIYL